MAIEDIRGHLLQAQKEVSGSAEPVDGIAVLRQEFSAALEVGWRGLESVIGGINAALKKYEGGLLLHSKVQEQIQAAAEALSKVRLDQSSNVEADRIGLEMSALFSGSEAVRSAIQIDIESIERLMDWGQELSEELQEAQGRVFTAGQEADGGYKEQAQSTIGAIDGFMSTM